MAVVEPTAVAPLQEECKRLRDEVRVLELQVRSLKQQLWGRKSERSVPGEANQPGLFSTAEEAVTVTPAPAAETSPGPRTGTSRSPMGPKPLDPALPREEIAVPSPALPELMCPVTKRPRQPGFVEVLEVLARRPAVYYVKQYTRTVFVSPAKTAPVYSP